MDFNLLDRALRDSLADLRLSADERDELRELGENLTADQVRFMRNRAFALVRDLVTNPEEAMPALEVAGAGGAHFGSALPGSARAQQCPLQSWRKLPPAYPRVVPAGTQHGRCVRLHHLRRSADKRADRHAPAWSGGAHHQRQREALRRWQRHFSS